LRKRIIFTIFEKLDTVRNPAEKDQLTIVEFFTGQQFNIADI